MKFNKQNIVPSEFRYLDSFDMGGTEPEDIPFNLKECAKLMEQQPAENFTYMDQCCVCGTRFRYGEVWEHVPSGTRISIGHICAGHYGLYANTAEYDRLRACDIRRRERIKKRRAIRGQIRTFMTNHRDLSPALRVDHAISRDLRAKLIKYGYLTAPQVELAKKLERDAAERHEAEEELGPTKDVPVVAQRRVITAVLLGIKWEEGPYGVDTCRMLVEVRDPDGRYKLYGTMPSMLQDQLMERRESNESLKDVIRRLRPTVRFTAMFRPSDRDKTFGFFNRPMKPEVL